MSTCPFLSVTKGFSSWGLLAISNFFLAFYVQFQTYPSSRKAYLLKPWLMGYLYSHTGQQGQASSRETGEAIQMHYILLSLTLEIHSLGSHIMYNSHSIHKAIRQTAWIPMLVIFYPHSYTSRKNKDNHVQGQNHCLQTEFFCVIIFQHFLS